MNQDDLESTIIEIMEDALIEAASEGTVHGALRKRGFNVDKKFVIRTLDLMVAVGKLEIMDEKKGLRRYSLTRDQKVH